MGDATSGPVRLSFNPQLRVEFRGAAVTSDGAQEQSAYNGHFESVCYHPLFVFNQGGDCLAATLRPGNVHSADGWDPALLSPVPGQ